jgi:hypothetical protein
LQEDGVTYGWNEITDKYILQCLKTATDAKTEAQQKKRVFVAQPTAEDAYDVGDMWVNATYLNADNTYLYENDSLVCKTAKAAGVAFSINHWKPASYATKANIFNTGEAIRIEVQGSIGAVNESVAALKVTVDSIEAAVEKINIEEGNITNINTSGLLLEDDFVSLFSLAVDADGNIVKQAQISTFVTSDEVEGMMSGITIDADQINFIGKTIINGAFVVDEEGNITLNDITAVDITASGRFTVEGGSKIGDISILSTGVMKDVGAMLLKSYAILATSSNINEYASSLLSALPKYSAIILSGTTSNTYTLNLLNYSQLSSAFGSSSINNNIVTLTFMCPAFQLGSTAANPSSFTITAPSGTRLFKGGGNNIGSITINAGDILELIAFPHASSLPNITIDSVDYHVKSLIQ